MSHHLILKHILSILIIQWGCSIYGQEIIIHHDSITDITCNSLGQVWIKDNRGEIFNSDQNHLIKSRWSENHLKFWNNDYQKAILSAGPFLYEGGEKKLENIGTDKSDISFATACSNGAVVMMNNFQLSVLHKGQLETCPIALSPDAILSIEYFRGKYLALTKQGIHELCGTLDISFTNDLNYTSMCLMSHNELLVGTEGSGIWIFKNDQFRQLYTPGVNFPDKIQAISKRDSDLFILDKDRIFYHYNWDSQVLHTIDEGVSTYTYDPWNTLWYIKGRSIIKNTDFINDQLPVMVFDRVESNYKIIEHRESISYETAQNGVAIFTKGYYPPRNDDIRYLYSLDGGATWNSNGNKGTVILDKLNPGRHKILVKSTVNDIHFSDPAEVVLNIRSNFLKTGWFYFLVGLILFISVAFAALTYNNVKNKRWVKERQKIKLELELSRKQQQLGQLQLNPHFLFNSLNSISGLIALKDNQNARKYLNQFSQMMRSLLNQSLDDSILLSEEIAFLEKYLALEKMINNDKFDFVIENNFNSDPRIPIMLLQPFVENAILHGIKSKSGRGQIKVTFSKAEKHILATISDDGVGRDFARENKKPEHQSNALHIIQERLEKLDKWHKGDHIKFEDLKDAHNNPTGTNVTIYIPKIHQ